MKKRPIKILFLTVIIFQLVVKISAQSVSENVITLTKKAHKGYLQDAGMMSDGNIQITYKIAGDKKKNELFYEQYIIGKDLKLSDTKQISEPKVDSKPDREKIFFSATVDQNMKLILERRNELQEWNTKKQQFETKKVLNKESVKAENSLGQNYYGIDQFVDETENELVFAYVETKDKSNPKKFLFLSIDKDLKVKEIPLDISGSQSLVFSYQVPKKDEGNGINRNDIILVFAPKKTESDFSKYTLVHYDMTGKLKTKKEFGSPASNLYINSADVKNGSIYFCATSTIDKDPFEKVFTDYAAILSPKFKGSRNAQMLEWEERGNQKMDNFHFLKFTGNQMEFATTVPIKDFKAKVKKSSNGGKGEPYKGKKFDVQTFFVTPNGDYLIAGQIIDKTTLSNGDVVKTYEDIICLHFDIAGDLKAQYVVEKMNDDQKSLLWEMPMHFYLSQDNKNVYWEIYEIKGVEGYETYKDDEDGHKTNFATYFPRIAKIELSSSNIGEFKVLGQKKYFMNRNYPGVFVPSDNSYFYFGKDEDNEKIWIGKVTFD